MRHLRGRSSDARMGRASRGSRPPYGQGAGPAVSELQSRSRGYEGRPGAAPTGGGLSGAFSIAPTNTPGRRARTEESEDFPDGRAPAKHAVRTLR